MKLSEPKVITFLIAVVIAVVGLLAYFGVFLGGYEFWIMLVAFVLLALANLLKGL
jgi:hypothetical protein